MVIFFHGQNGGGTVIEVHWLFIISVIKFLRLTCCTVSYHLIQTCCDGVVLLIWRTLVQAKSIRNEPNTCHDVLLLFSDSVVYYVSAECCLSSLSSEAARSDRQLE